MKVIISESAQLLGQRAASLVAELLNQTIREKGSARFLMSTGASQFTTIEALIKEDVDWTEVEMFHLDEYIGIDVTHPASFIRYLNERFISKVNLKKVHLVDPAAGVDTVIDGLTKELACAPVDVGLIGIGENAHIAFNDPPADFETTAAFHVVTLDMACRRQQLGEGWFGSLDEVPEKAISMTVGQIMKCRYIVSAVPYSVKAKAVRDTLENDVTNVIPATMLKTHEEFTLFLDSDSASMIDKSAYR